MIKQIELNEELSLIDFHSHLLPGVDDGSPDVDTSIEMLKALAKQGVKKVIATPHFYATQHSPEDFLEKRNAAVEILQKAIEERGDAEFLPEILLGAEVLYFTGISHSEAMRELRIENTDLLLLEMPFYPWNAAAVEEVLDMRSNLGIVPVLAHLDRYFPLQKKCVLNEIVGEDVLVQINAEAFCETRKAKKILKMLDNGEINFLGSDCHNLSDRAPNFDKAVEVIVKKKRADALLELCDFANMVFK